MRLLVLEDDADGMARGGYFRKGMWSTGDGRDALIAAMDAASALILIGWCPGSTGCRSEGSLRQAKVDASFHSPVGKWTTGSKDCAAGL